MTVRATGLRKGHLERRLGDRRDEDGGFTLIEILVVIVIMAILAAVVIFAVQNLSGQSARAACKSDFKLVEDAAGAYGAQVGQYPKVGDNAAATPNGAQIGGGLTAAMDGVDALFTSQQGLNNTGPVGPWLKDAPSNASHYTVNLSSDGRGKVTVSDAAGVGQPDCSGVQ